MPAAKKRPRRHQKRKKIERRVIDDHGTQRSVEVNIAERINKNPLVWLLAVVLTGFSAGIAAYQAVLEIAHLEIATKRSSCPHQLVALRVDAVPVNARIEITDLGRDYYPAICVKPGRYRLEVSAQGYRVHKRAIQIGASDYVALVELEPEAVIDLAGADPQYAGELLSLNFENIQVRAALQVFADFTGLNFIVADEVEGSITLRLRDVPWDQALNALVILKGLEVLRHGNVLIVRKKA